MCTTKSFQTALNVPLRVNSRENKFNLTVRPKNGARRYEGWHVPDIQLSHSIQNTLKAYKLYLNLPSFFSVKSFAIVYNEIGLVCK